MLEFLLKITFKFGAIVLNSIDLRSEIKPVLSELLKFLIVNAMYNKKRSATDANSDRQILEQLSHTTIQVLKTKYLYH